MPNPILQFAALSAAALLLALPPARAQTTIGKIAFIGSLTGAGQAFGAPALEGARLAIAEANAEHKLQTIELDVHDDTSSPDKGHDIAQQIAGSDALLIVGPSTTPVGLAVGPVCAQAPIACIGTSTTGDSVTGNANFYRAIFSTSDGGESIANYLRYILGGTKAVVIFKDDGFGKPFAEGFRRGSERLELGVKYFPFQTVAEAQDAARAAAADPSEPAIILGTISDNTPILAALRREGAKGPVLASNAIAGDFFAASFASEGEERAHPGFFTNGVYAATPLLLDSTNADTLSFVQRFRARFGKEPTYVTAQGYEAMRIAIAALREIAKAQIAPGVKARRDAIRAFLNSLDGPAHAVPGLNGPLWFTPERGRQQALRMGRFHGTQFESAPSQLVPVRHPDAAEIAGGTVVDIGAGRYARRQQVVYTGLFLNEVSRIDVAQSSFTADFYLWMRFARGADTGIAVPTEIDFPNLVRGSFDAARTAAQGDLDDGTTYRLWQVRGDFKNDYDLHRYPGDQQTIAISFFNARAASDRIVYVLDQRSFAGSALADDVPASAGEARAAAGVAQPSGQFGGGAVPTAFRNLSQWTPLEALQRRDNLVTQSALGDPRLVGLERMRELSGFNFTIKLRRRIGTTLAKTLLPLGLMALIMFASLYFPNALVKEKVTVAITGALSGAVLLSAINTQLGNVGYVIAVEYGFYVFFALCLLCIVSVLAAERLRAAQRPTAALAVEQTSRALFVIAFLGTAALGWYTLSQSL